MKIDFITNKCNRQLRSLLLDLFDQKFVTDQIGAIVAESKAGSGDSFCYLIKLLALSAAEFDMPFKSIAEVFGTKFANDFVQQRFSWQREFFHNAHGRQTIKSVLLAIFLLRTFVNDRDIIDNVAELCFTVDQMSEVNPIYRKKVSRLLRYGFIERLLDDEGKREKLVRFYEAVRQYGVGGRNPQFWLQYAIARMSFRDYEAAGAYFDTAFALAEGFRDYDDYMISTHYARFLLESRVNGNSYTDFAENFFAVHDEIMRQSGRLNSAHYPYRIATQYLSYLQAKADDFSQQDIERAKTCCLELLSRIDSLTPELKLNRYVVRCKRCMTESLEFLAAFDE